MPSTYGTLLEQFVPTRCAAFVCGFIALTLQALSTSAALQGQGCEIAAASFLSRGWGLVPAVSNGTARSAL